VEVVAAAAVVPATKSGELAFFMVISLSSLLLFVGGALILLVIPGPAVTYIVSRSIEHGRTAGLVSVMGVVTGTLCHLAAATLGLSALLLSSPRSLQLVKYVGAGYIVYLGIRTLRGKDAEWIDEPARATARFARLFGEGMLVNVLNPKTAFFFFAFLPQFVDAARGHATLQILELGLLFVVLSWCTDSVYAWVGGSIGKRIRGSARLRRAERNIAGGFLIALGLACAFAGARTK
jgi:threonine/homoserine/homoserine lactone efflux protein